MKLNSNYFSIGSENVDKVSNILYSALERPVPASGLSKVKRRLFPYTVLRSAAELQLIITELTSYSAALILLEFPKRSTLQNPHNKIKVGKKNSIKAENKKSPSIKYPSTSQILSTYSID